MADFPVSKLSFVEANLGSRHLTKIWVMLILIRLLGMSRNSFRRLDGREGIRGSKELSEIIEGQFKK